MNDQKRLIVRLTGAVDLSLVIVLILRGTNWLGALLIVEVLMWMVRLVWISPILLRFIFRRLLHMIPIILTTIALGFFLIRLAPGDVFTAMALNPQIRPEALATFRDNFGLNQPWYVQFFKYLWNVLHGDFGFSENFKAPVFWLVNQRTINTLILTIPTIVLAWGFSIPAGIIAARNQYSWKDQIVSILAFIGLSIPNFFLAFLLLYLISVSGNWLPIGGMYSVDVNEMNAIQKFWDLAKHAAVPVFVLTTGTTAGLVRVMRANMLEILGMQYTTTARAKGLSERKVVYKHALRNAINPMITLFGFQLGAILGGAALTENVTAWPGLGRLILRALLTQDLYLVVGSLIYSVALLVVGNLIADILLAVVDPRVRIS